MNHEELHRAFVKALKTHFKLQAALEAIMALEGNQAAKDIALHTLAENQKDIHGTEEKVEILIEELRS